MCAYVGDYYRADQEAIGAFAPMNQASIETLADDKVVFKPESATKGLIFYPGGKVEHTAYQPFMAAAYVSDHVVDYEGLILLGSYSTVDLSQTDLDVLSVYGSEDQVMNRENYEKSKSNLPNDFTEVIIDGCCHAYFGMYGAQSGDGTPTISNEQQISLTAEQIVGMMKK